MRRLVLLLVALVALAACGSDDTADSATTAATSATTTTTTIDSTTTTIEQTTTTTIGTTTTTSRASSEVEESAEFPGSGETAFLTSVGVSEDASIIFEFEGDTVPAYRVEYVEPPIRADASGREVDLAGDAFLQVMVSPGSGVDLSGDEPRETFTGEDRFVVDSVAGISELAETGDFEAVLTWTIGLMDRHPFSVQASPGSLVVDLDVSGNSSTSLLDSDPATCSSADGFAVSYPSDWWASDGEFACSYFAPEQVAIQPGTDVTTPVMMFVDAVGFQTAVAPSESRNELTRAVSTLDGRAVVRLVSTVEEGLYPRGTEVTSYFVDLETSDGADQTLVATTADLDGYDYGRNKALLDEMFRTIELDRPGPDDLVATYRGGGTPFDVTVDASGSETCLTVAPGGQRTCLESPTGNRVVAAIAGEALVGLAGPDVFAVDVENSVTFLPVETVSGTYAWAVPFDGSDFTVLGSDGDTIRITTTS